MIPIADYIINPLHWAFQLTTAKMGVSFLQTLGFTAYLENQYIVLPSITLEVAQACSGISYLISIVAIGIPLAYVSQKNVWCRWTLVISAVIIGVIANWVRVAGIGIWAYYGGQVLHGPFHIFQALFVAHLGFVALFAGAWVLSKVPAGASKTFQVHPGFRSEKKDAANNRFMDQPWPAPLLILIGLSSYLYFHQQIPVSLKTDLALFPMSIMDWKGRVNEPRDAVFRVPGADHELVRTYTSRSGNEIRLYVAYFESQRHTKEIINYLTAPLHDNSTEVVIPTEGEKPVTVNQARINNEQTFFWYDLNGSAVANRYRAKLATTLNNLFYGQTNGALVLVTTVHKDRDNYEDSKEEEMAFVRELVPVLRRYLP
jgi:EpsI family protein